MNTTLLCGDIVTSAHLAAEAATCRLAAGEVLGLTVDATGAFTGGIEIADSVDQLPAGQLWATVVG